MPTYMSGDDIREAFLSYFEAQGHSRVASSSLIPVGDPTLLLTTAGMVQFKPYYSGEAAPPNQRLTSSQKSFRTVDIDEVGDATHLTLFEMLGNFSIGDYFKKDAIRFALDMLDTKLGLPRERFAITVHDTDEEALGLWQDVGVPASRIYKFGDADNWWGPAGDEGPCGPCSELHYDFGEGRGCLQSDCGPNCENIMNAAGEVCNRYVELWNLVFMQFYHHLDGHRTPLPAPSIDTGLGLERAAVVMQDVPTIYETDIFRPMVQHAEEIAAKRWGADRDTDYALAAIAEHGRSATFLIADGVVPGNEGRGYVLRRLIRRAIRHGRLLGLEDPFLGNIAEVTIDKMGGVYPELANNQEFIYTVIRLEEERFFQNADRGMRILGEGDESGIVSVRRRLAKEISDLAYIKACLDNPGLLYNRITQATVDVVQPIVKPQVQRNLTDPLHDLLKQTANALKDPLYEKIEGLRDIVLKEVQKEALKLIGTVSGEEAFLLWDTYGFPVEMTQEIARGQSVAVDIAGFEREMEAQRERGRASAQFGEERAKIRLYESLNVGATRFLGYDQLNASSPIVGLIADDAVVSEAAAGQNVEVVLVQTPFYAEGGGQVGDAGILTGPDGSIEVRDTQAVMPDVIVHFGRVSAGVVRLGDTVEAQVDPVRRQDTARNHTATHMLHAALREVLGAHVRQAGSLVAPDRLRFDFSHVQPVTQAELWQVQLLVNEKIRANTSVRRDEDTYASAIRRGALAFFGDRYGDRVRLIEIANGDTFSFEVCGGTHVGHTGEVGNVYILGESGIGAGMRRLEAVSGRAAERLVWERFSQQDGVSRMLQTSPPELEARVGDLLAEIDDLRRQLEATERRNALQAAELLLDMRQDVNGVSVLAARVDASNADSLREISDWLRDKMGSGIVILGAVINERPTISIGITRDLVAAGADAREYARDLGKIIGGGGGGRADMAQAGGRDASRLDDAIAGAPDLARQKTA